MKSPSEQHNTKTDNQCDPRQQIIAALDNSTERLSADTLSDLEKIRHRALNKMPAKRGAESTFTTIKNWFSLPYMQIGLPVAFVMLMLLYLPEESVNAVPEMPLAMIDTELPSEDLNMLEELEFIEWLAANESTALL